MSFNTLLELIEEAEQQAQECDKGCREKYFDLLDTLNEQLERKIKNGDYN